MFKTLTKDNFYEEIKSGLKLIEFYTHWCGYCQKQEDVLKELNKIYIGQVDAEKEVELAMRYSIHSFPTFLIFRNGKEVERFSGLRNKYDLMNIIMKYL